MSLENLLFENATSNFKDRSMSNHHLMHNNKHLQLMMHNNKHPITHLFANQPLQFWECRNDTIRCLVHELRSVTFDVEESTTPWNSADTLLDRFVQVRLSTAPQRVVHLKNEPVIFVIEPKI